MNISKSVKWACVLAYGASIIYLENRRPLRPSKESFLPHNIRNLLMAALSAWTIQKIKSPVVQCISRGVEKRNLGVVQAITMSPLMKKVVCIILLDYTLYLWHVLTHRNSFLWRFHQVHHTDRDLTATTAFRFHAGEMLLSTLWSAAQVILIGVPPETLKIWESLTLAEIAFHHSNIRLPASFEKLLSNFVVTPRIHEIHHSQTGTETASNWSSGLTIWDVLHGTACVRFGDGITSIGVPGFLQETDVTLAKLLREPFLPKRPSGHSQAV